jgi:hypothetical protein
MAGITCTWVAEDLDLDLEIKDHPMDREDRPTDLEEDHPMDLEIKEEEPGEEIQTIVLHLDMMIWLLPKLVSTSLQMPMTTIPIPTGEVHPHLCSGLPTLPLATIVVDLDKVVLEVPSTCNIIQICMVMAVLEEDTIQTLECHTPASIVTWVVVLLDLLAWILDIPMHLAAMECLLMNTPGCP